MFNPNETQIDNYLDQDDADYARYLAERETSSQLRIELGTLRLEHARLLDDVQAALNKLNPHIITPTTNIRSAADGAVVAIKIKDAALVAAKSNYSRAWESYTRLIGAVEGVANADQ